MEQILAALRQLDPLNDDHWTANGDPRIDAVKALAGQGVEVDRQTIVNAAPDLTRATAGQPESLLMNQDEKPKDEEVTPEPMLVADFDEGVVFDPISALLGNSTGLTNELLYKALAEAEGLTDQELLVLHGNMNADDLTILVPAFEKVEKAMQDMVNRGNQRIKDYRRMTAITKNKLNVLRPEQSNQDAIRTYLEAQNKSRMEAAQNRSIILRNLDLKTLTPVSQLDQAMARKTSRGTQRPKFNT